MYAIVTRASKTIALKRYRYIPVKWFLAYASLSAPYSIIGSLVLDIFLPYASYVPSKDTRPTTLCSNVSTSMFPIIPRIYPITVPLPFLISSMQYFVLSYFSVIALVYFFLKCVSIQSFSESSHVFTFLKSFHPINAKNTANIKKAVSFSPIIITPFLFHHGIFCQSNLIQLYLTCIKRHSPHPL